MTKEKGVTACEQAGFDSGSPHGRRGVRLRGKPLPACTVREGVVMRRRNAETFYDPDGNEINW